MIVHTAREAALALLRLAVRRGAPPDDPLGPTSQDPDAVRESACKLTAPDRVCTPAKPPTIRTGSGGGGFGSIIELLLWLLFIGLVVLLVVVIVRALLLRTPARRRRRTVEEIVDETVTAGHVAIDHRRTPAEWRAEADEHRRAGRHRDALRCRYRALVGDLARRNVIDEIPGRTTGEERDQLARVAPASRGSFDAAADLFDGAWYGHVDVDDGDVAAMIELERDVLGRDVAR